MSITIIKIAGVVSMACILSACTTTQNLSTAPVEPRFTSESARKNVQRYFILTSRTQAFDANRRRVEKQGVQCRLKGNGFITNYTTPANLKLLVYAQNTSDLSMMCEYEGSKLFKQITVRNLTAEKISHSGASGGFIGSVLAMTISAARGNKPNDDYTYRNPYMFLSEKSKK